jgi:hypothetical protein
MYHLLVRSEMLQSAKQRQAKESFMHRNWRYIYLTLLFLFVALTLSHTAFAFWWPFEPKQYPKPFDAPEMDPKLAVEGIALAGAAAVLLWERIKRRR